MAWRLYNGVHNNGVMVNDPAKFAGKYRIPSTRMVGWDYGNAGWYFITICADGRVCWFGDVRDGTMRLSDAGRIVHDEWYKTGIIRSYVHLDAFVVMPNHVHGIIVIQPPKTATMATINHNPHHHPEWKPGSLGSIIQQFKRACTVRIHAIGHSNFAWQARYHDHVIRHEYETFRIRWYIENNPMKWDNDHLFA